MEKTPNMYDCYDDLYYEILYSCSVPCAYATMGEHCDEPWKPTLDSFRFAKQKTMHSSSASVSTSSTVEGDDENSTDGDEPKREKTNQTKEGFRGAADDYENPRNKNEVEVIILKGILDYYSKNGAYPFKGLVDLSDSIKNSSSLDLSASQLMIEIEGLKEKYEKIADKKGLRVNYPSAHDLEVFELSKKIWGNGTKNVDDQSKFRGEESKSVKGGQEEQDFSMYPFLKEALQFGNSSNRLVLVLRESILEQGLRLLGSSRLKEMDEEWRKMQVEESEFCEKWEDLIRQQKKRILAAVKSSLK